MSEIKPGDWAATFIPYTCCGHRPPLLHIPRVVMEIGKDDLHCPLCLTFWIDEPWCSFGDGYVLLKRVKKIPPLNELEDQTEERKVEV